MDYIGWDPHVGHHVWWLGNEHLHRLSINGSGIPTSASSISSLPNMVSLKFIKHVHFCVINVVCQKYTKTHSFTHHTKCLDHSSLFTRMFGDSLPLFHTLASAVTLCLLMISVNIPTFFPWSKRVMPSKFFKSFALKSNKLLWNLCLPIRWRRRISVTPPPLSASWHLPLDLMSTNPQAKMAQLNVNTNT